MEVIAGGIARSAREHIETEIKQRFPDAHVFVEGTEGSLRIEIVTANDKGTLIGITSDEPSSTVLKALMTPLPGHLQMSRKGRHKKRVKRTRASVCGDGEKTRYPSQEAAEQTRQSYISQGIYHDAVRVYWCQFCKSFHVGRIRKPDFRATKNRMRQWK